MWPPKCFVILVDFIININNGKIMILLILINILIMTIVLIQKKSFSPFQEKRRVMK